MSGDLPHGAALDQVRLDVWLDVSCLFKTRSEAQRACRGGKVEVNGQPGKPHRFLRSDDLVVIMRPSGTRQTVRVLGLADRSLPKADARLLYEDLTPPPPPEEIALRRADRVFRAAQAAAGPPDKRQRRAIRKIRGY
jgi:ribosome-associated heat shock protein Hsp15